MKALQSGPLPDVARLAPGLPADVVGLVRSALTVDRARRLEEVDAFASVLARHVHAPRANVPA
jgi:hypothetical protein